MALHRERQCAVRSSGHGYRQSRFRHGRHDAWHGVRLGRAPACLGAKVKSYDDKAALQVRGVKQTLTIAPFKPPHHFQPLGGVAVIADNTWAAFQGTQGFENRLGYEPERQSTTPMNSVRRWNRSPASPARWCARWATWMRNSPRVGRSWRRTITLRIWRMLQWSRRWPWRNIEMEKFWLGRRRRILKPCRKRLPAVLGIKKRTSLATSRSSAEVSEESQSLISWRKQRVLSKQLGKPVKVVWSREDDIHSITSIRWPRCI